MKNFSHNVFLGRYVSPGADLEEWRLQWHEDVKAGEKAKVASGKVQRSGVPGIKGTGLICCPEDQLCQRACKAAKKF